MAKSVAGTIRIGSRCFVGSEQFDVFNPATGDAFASAPLCGELELEEAVEAATKAKTAWANNELNRRQALVNCAEDIEKNIGELSLLITQEQGKPIVEARQEIHYAARIFAQYARIPIANTNLEQNRTTRTVLIQRPFGIVGLITPWNFPVGTVAVKLAPALLAGNTAILKPSPHAPLSGLLLAKIISNRLPEGVLSALSGGDELGASIARHPKIRKLSLTGSVEAGQATLAAAAVEIKSVTLELGGNDPAIVLPDANISEIAGPILDAAWRNAGQVCSAIKRVYVHFTEYENLVSALKHEAAKHIVGDGMDRLTTMGPITTKEQLERLESYARQVQSAGGTLHCSSLSAHSSGYFIAPSIATNIPYNHPLVTEEQFGPILPILPFETIEDAITLANEGDYGLSASVWTKNATLGAEVASLLECGRVGINGHKRAGSLAPFGGFKRSGLGRELGEWGLREMCESQVVNVFN